MFVGWPLRWLASRAAAPQFGDEQAEQEQGEDAGECGRGASVSIPHTTLSGVPSGRVAVDLLANASSGASAAYASFVDDGFPSALASTAVEVPATAFVSSLSKVAVAASTDASRPLLTGVFLKVLGARMTIAATDSYRLCVASIPLLASGGALEAVVEKASLIAATSSVPASASTVAVSSDGQMLWLRLGSVLRRCPIILGQFPDVEMLFAPTDGESGSTIVS